MSAFQTFSVDCSDLDLPDSAEKLGDAIEQKRLELRKLGLRIARWQVMPFGASYFHYRNSGFVVTIETVRGDRSRAETSKCGDDWPQQITTLVYGSTTK